MQNPQPCRLKVKVTQFEPWISCLLHISFNPGRIFIKLQSNVCPSETVRRTHYSTIQIRDQSHSWRSWDWALNFVSPPYLLYPWKDFSLNWLIVWLSEMMCRNHLNHANSRSRSQLKVMSFEPWIFVHPVSLSLGEISFNFVKCSPQWDNMQNP